MIVVDATLLVHFVLPGPDRSTAVRVRETDTEWAAPPLWASEVRNALLKYVRADLLPLDRAVALMQQAEQAVAERVLPVTHNRVLGLASASGCTAYDCEYVALAQALGVPLVTTDKQVLRAFPEAARHPRDFAA